jgi:4-diphosphocytidyl-2-C-methyl-D-erythritol kinase
LEAKVRTLKLASFAKINLGLEVLFRRRDGYHELRTLFQTIDLHDDIVLRPRAGGVAILCEHPGVPRDGTNLAARAALALGRFAGEKRGVEIHITKRIPVAGGLGGGSSNAATVLLGLDRLWGLGLGPPGLHPLARRLGADVPFFLLGGTALGLGRGDEVYPLKRQLKAHVVVVDPALPISTAAVFKRLDSGLTPRANGHTIFCFVSRDLEGERAYALLSNDLEKAALEEAPELKVHAGRIRGMLVREGALMVALSGSGASFFGLFDDARGAQRAHAALRGAGFHAYRGRTLSFDEYRRGWIRSGGGAGGRAR